MLEIKAKNIVRFAAKATLKGVIYVIYAYRYLISPLLGRNCRFYPTCSQYAQEALVEHGLMKGIFLSVRRILKCNPFNPGGVDLVPKKIDNKKLQ